MQGCEITPDVYLSSGVHTAGDATRFVWKRCVFHLSCAACSKSPVRMQCIASGRYFCCSDCFTIGWPHRFAPREDRNALLLQKAIESGATDGNYGSGSSNDEHLAHKWMDVAHTLTYIPTTDDVGRTLRLVCTPVSNDGTRRGPSKAIDTATVMAQPPPPPPRRRLVVRNEPPEVVGCDKSSSMRSGADGAGGLSLTVSTYNVLADLYALQDTYPYCPSWALAWPFRRRNLLRDLQQLGADVFCLQEVQADHYEQWFEPQVRARTGPHAAARRARGRLAGSARRRARARERAWRAVCTSHDARRACALMPSLARARAQMDKLGYSGLYKRKTREFMGQYGKMDGCALFYKRDKLVPADGQLHAVEFNTIAVNKYSHGGGEKKRLLNRLLKDNVAQVTIFALVGSSLQPGGATHVCIANTHINANTEFADVKLWQTQLLLLEVQRIIGEFHNGLSQQPIPVVIAGDFNSTPGSSPYNLLAAGYVERDNVSEDDPVGIIASLPLEHHLVLRSVRASWRARGARIGAAVVWPARSRSLARCLTHPPARSARPRCAPLRRRTRRSAPRPTRPRTSSTAPCSRPRAWSSRTRTLPDISSARSITSGTRRTCSSARRCSSWRTRRTSRATPRCPRRSSRPTTCRSPSSSSCAPAGSRGLRREGGGGWPSERGARVCTRTRAARARGHSAARRAAWCGPARSAGPHRRGPDRRRASVDARRPPPRHTQDQEGPHARGAARPTRFSAARRRLFAAQPPSLRATGRHAALPS